ncbi:MAG: DNA polymerase IV [Pseudomonadota bacterium]|nr:DNA polymerase IV [Pseudomonadota bacterium]
MKNHKLKIYADRKIIHIDMDCFFAAVEIREKPELKYLPVAVAGSEKKRGVVTTCNYVAREYGVKSAMPSVTAKQLCPNIIFLPVNFAKYKKVSSDIKEIYKCYTKIIEPIALDEAYLDVTNSRYCDGDPENMARQIRQKIFDDFKLTASAGISSNKFLAKIASDWNKPNGQFSIRDDEIKDFIPKVPIRKIFGIGEKNEKKLLSHNIKDCSDLQKLNKSILIDMFGKYGITLFNLCRGIDDREVESNRISKSLSVEDTFAVDLLSLNECTKEMKLIFQKLITRLETSKDRERPIKSCFIKIKYSDFKITSSQTACSDLNFDIISNLLVKSYQEKPSPIRLLGVGVRFSDFEDNQLDLKI